MHYTTILNAIALGLGAAVISVTMIVILSNEPILNWWFSFGYRVGIKNVGGREVERWFYRPVWGCEKCFAGQIALWSYFAMHSEIRRGNPFGLCCDAWWIFHSSDYSPFAHVVAISSAVLLAVIISRIVSPDINQDTE